MVIGSAARGFAQPKLCFAILFEQVIRYSCYQRRKMRMERIEPHLRFRNLNCFGGLPDRIEDLLSADKIYVDPKPADCDFWHAPSAKRGGKRRIRYVAVFWAALTLAN
jgi:hypothetical protein